jgi:sugar diacid utilization regulator
VCDRQGTIRAAVVKSRIGGTHSGAQKILRGEVDEYFVTAEEEAASGSRVKEGCNSYVSFEGERVATFGIAGKLEVARPLARVAARVLTSWIHELAQRRRVRQVSGRAFEAVRQLGARVDETAAAADRAAGDMMQASQEAAQRVASTDDVVRRVQDIAQQSRMLSLNGSVGATRAGHHGRAFAVIAREMLELAEDAQKAAKEIQARLAEVRQTVGAVESASASSRRSGQEQLETLRTMRQSLVSLQEAIAGLDGNFASGRR